MNGRGARRSRAALLGALAVCAVALGAGTARAAAANSPSACAALAAESPSKLGIRDDAVELPGLEDALNKVLLVATGLMPNVGVRVPFYGSGAATIVSWSMSLPFGPTTACERRWGGFYELKRLRLVLEPGIAIDTPSSVFLRPGLRAVWHRGESPLGLGVGFGSTLEWIHDRGTASLSPELLLHMAACCSPGYWLISVRGDWYLNGDAPASWLATLGVAYW